MPRHGKAPNSIGGEQGALVSALLAPADLHAARADTFLAAFKRLADFREKPPPPFFKVKLSRPCELLRSASSQLLFLWEIGCQK